MAFNLRTDLSITSCNGDEVCLFDLGEGFGYGYRIWPVRIFPLVGIHIGVLGCLVKLNPPGHHYCGYLEILLSLP